jgi:hypothetical protein
MFTHSYSAIVLFSSYLPPVSYFAYLASKTPVIIEQWEHYPKQTYRNRCHIHSANGLLPLSIPVLRGNLDHTAMKNVRISQEVNWQKIHWRSIESAYRSSPFFEYYEEEFSGFYEKKCSYLLDFNSELLAVLLKILKISPDISFSGMYLKSYGNEVLDLRDTIHPKKDTALFRFEPYYQVFEKKNGFIPDLSIIDLLFNTGPESINYLTKILPAD